MRNLSTTFALLAILLTLLLTGRAAMSETSKGASVGQDKPNEVGEEQAAAVAQFARNFPSTFHFGGRLTGSLRRLLPVTVSAGWATAEIPAISR